MIWIIFAVMTALAVCAILWPLARMRALSAHQAAFPPPSSLAHARAIYDSAMTRIRMDVERGLLSQDNADVLEAEAARRLVREQNENEQGDISTRSLKWSSLFAVLIIPSLALVLYDMLGNPDVPDMPLEKRMNAPLAQMDFAAAMARMEKHLKDKPDDVAAIAIVAPIYLKMGQFDKAAAAYRSLRAHGKNDVETNMGLATALLQLEQGHVSPEARSAYEDALKQDSNLYEAQFYIGMAQQQAGEIKQAAQTWIDLYQRSPKDAPWLADLAEQIKNVGGGVPLAAASAHPTQNPDIIAMVERLAQRLKDQPRDVNGWRQLIRSYRVLHDDTKLAQALERIREIFKEDQKIIDELTLLARN
jgi:cytochrome c-type biogenesis protein CcmH